MPPKAPTTAPVPPAQPPEKDEKYAAALAQMATLEYEMQQKEKPEQKHFISKKMLIYLGVSTALSLLVWVYFAVTHKDPVPGINSDTTKELLDTTKELRDLQN